MRQQSNLRVHTNALARYSGKALLCVTHSDRPTEIEKCDLNYLEARYASPQRLARPTPFEALTPSSLHSPYLGEVSIYSLNEDAKRFDLVCHFSPQHYKPQHAMWHRGHLWVAGVEHVEVYDSALRTVAVLKDPWLAGGHTIASDGRGHLLVPCASSDSVLVFDEKTKAVVGALRMPESLYGSNYSLRRTDSVVDHFIPNDLQRTHVNCAWPWRDGILVSALIPGALGWFDPAGAYRELLKGFVGCHGVRVRSDTGEIYFTDSCLGATVFLDAELRITRRISTGSRWLHDSLHIGGDVFALADTERNEVLMYDVSTRTVISRLSCRGKGGGPQFLSFGK